MIRKQFYLTPEQNRTLESLSRLRGVSQAKLVREALDCYLLTHPSDTIIHNTRAVEALLATNDEIAAHHRFPDPFHLDRHTLYTERENRLTQRAT